MELIFMFLCVLELNNFIVKEDIKKDILFYIANNTQEERKIYFKNLNCIIFESDNFKIYFKNSMFILKTNYGDLNINYNFMKDINILYMMINKYNDKIKNNTIIK